MFLIGLLIGLILGTSLGIFLLALMQSARRGREELDKTLKGRPYR